MTTTSTAQFIAITSSSSSQTLGTFEATLTDSDLIRGNDPNEQVENDGFSIFNGFTVFTSGGRDFRDGEVSTTVTFSDGTVLENVLALTDRFSGGFTNTNLFLLDEETLAANGRTLADVADIDITAFVDHDLSWADLGFGDGSVTPPDPDPEPEPDPDPMPNVIEGTDGRDRLSGTDGADVIIGGDGNDRLTGNAGGDTFVFGADARDGGRDRDVITDFDASEDVIVIEDGATIRRVFERNGDTFVQLDGDRDLIILRDTDASVVDSFVFADDSFLV